MTLRKGICLKFSGLKFRFVFILLVKFVFEKNEKPSIYMRSKIRYLDLFLDTRWTLTLFVLGGGLNQPTGLKNAFFGRLSTKNRK